MVYITSEIIEWSERTYLMMGKKKKKNKQHKG